MQKKFLMLFCLMLILSGCDQMISSDEEILKPISSEKNEVAKIKAAQQKIQESKLNNSINQEKNMSQKNAEEEINMDLAETCQEAIIKTNKGDVTINFYNEKAPTTVANFCTLAKDGFYDGIRFHRVIKDFMIQAGDPNSKDLTKKSLWGTGDPGYKFKDELPKAGEYKLGSIAMANSGPNTNGSQFFIVSGPSGVSLPPLYSLFGEVTTGMDIVESIQNSQTEMNDRPVEEVLIESIEIVKK